MSIKPGELILSAKTLIPDAEFGKTIEYSITFTRTVRSPGDSIRLMKCLADDRQIALAERDDCKNKARLAINMAETLLKMAKEDIEVSLPDEDDAVWDHLCTALEAVRKSEAAVVKHV